MAPSGSVASDPLRLGLKYGQATLVRMRSLRIPHEHFVHRFNYLE